MIRCCIFDADGTLLDSMPMWRDITYQYAADKGIQAPQGLHNTLNRLSLEQCAEYYRGLGVSGTVEGIAQELGQYALEGYRTQVEEKPQAREFLQLLKENHIPVAVATASNREGVELALERLGMLPLWTALSPAGKWGKARSTRTSSCTARGNLALPQRRAWSLRTRPTPSAPPGTRDSRWWLWKTPSPSKAKGKGKPGRALPGLRTFPFKAMGS